MTNSTPVLRENVTGHGAGNGTGVIPYNRASAESAAVKLGELSRASLARAMGVGSAMVSRVMSGDRMPSTETLAKLNRATGLSMESLFSYFLMRKAERQLGMVQ
jgi:hypothetical protein